MISRRSFLIGGGAALTGWLVNPTLARQIIHAAQEHRQILTVPMKNPRDVLYLDDRMMFTLNGKWDDERPVITWEELIEREGFDTRCPKDLAIYAEEYLEIDVDELPFTFDLKKPVPEERMSSYYEGAWLSQDCPEARAFHYLAELDLGPLENPAGKELGRLEFVDGICPGNDSLYVQASTLEVASGLQHRLLELGEDVEVRTYFQPGYGMI